MSRIAQRRAGAGAVALRQKALMPEERFCRILRKKIVVLIEYSDYKSHWNKGPEGTIYCENIVPCYQSNVPCRYSGLSPLYPDPFEGVPRDVREAEELFGVAPAKPEETPEAETVAEEPGEEGD